MAGQAPFYDGVAYAKPLAEYDCVVADFGLFRSTLESFHQTMGTRFRFPSVGGDILDLHKLFVEVTSRGGASKLVMRRRWKEVVDEFDFPVPIKNPHLKLRDHYLAYLYHYEQVYFFKAQGYWHMAGIHTPGRVVPYISYGLGTNVP